MRFVLPVALSLFLLLGPALADMSPGYFPRTPGTIWRYSSGEVQQALATKTVQGVQVTPVSHTVGAQLISVDYLEYRGGGVFLRGVQAAGTGGRLSWYEPPLVVYPPGPLQAGQQWSSASVAVKKGTGSLRLSGQVIGSRALTTALGSFNALVIRNDISSGNTTKNPSAQYVYFVPGLGVVRYQSADGSTVDLVK